MRLNYYKESSRFSPTLAFFTCFFLTADNLDAQVKRYQIESIPLLPGIKNERQLVEFTINQ